MKVVIIEDETLASDNIVRMLYKINQTIIIAAIIDNVSDAVTWLSNNKVDLIFLDIHLGDDSSFKIFQSVDIKTPIIFTTAYNQYAIQAFKVNSIDYLLKPFTLEELQFSLKKFTELQSNIPDYRQVIKQIEDRNSFQERFMVTSGQKIKSIPVENVAFFLSEGRYVKLVTFQNDKYLLDSSLDALQIKLDPNDFFRINRQVIISFSSIKQMIIWSKSRVKLELNPHCENETIVSIDKSGDFKKWLNR